MNEAQIEHWINSGRLTTNARTSLEARLAGLKQDTKRSAAPAREAPAAPTAAAPKKADRSALDAASAKWVEGQKADIDVGAERSLSQGMSNMIGSGLAGSTAVGGMTAGVGEAATRAKTAVEGEAAMRTEGLALQYAGLGQAASESALNRQFQASEGAASRASSEKIATMGASMGGAGRGGGGGTSTPGLDAFGKPMSGSMAMKATQMSGGGLAQKYPNLSAAAPDVFKF